MKPALANASPRRLPRWVTLDFWVPDCGWFAVMGVIGGGLAEGGKNPHKEDQDGISVGVWAEGGHSREKCDGWMSDFLIFVLTKAAC